MTNMRRIVTAGLVAVLGGASAVGLSACSEDDIFGDDSDEQVEISLTERDLSPGRVSVDAGTIEFVVKNDGDRVHQFAIDTPDGVERTDEIKPGDSANVDVDLSRGRYRMYDPRGGYRNRGVSGVVVVTADNKRADTVTERTVERTVVEEDDDIDVPDVDEPEVQDPEVQEPPAAPPPPVAPPPVTKTVPAPPPADDTETTP